MESLYELQMNRNRLRNLSKFSEDDLLELSKEEFCKKYNISEDEWETMQKEFQEM